MALFQSSVVVYFAEAWISVTPVSLTIEEAFALVTPLPALIVRAVFAFNQFYLFMPFQGGSTLAALAYQLVQPAGTG